jgi:hypothetical protein
MNHITVQAGRPAAAVVIGFFLLATGGASASARPDPGPPPAPVAHLAECLLQRVDVQLVRCDDLTGNGVSAPEFITEH